MLIKKQAQSYIEQAVKCFESSSTSCCVFLQAYACLCMQWNGQKR